MKILHVVNSLDAGGMENGVVNLARSLESRGFTHGVACLERAGAFASRLPPSSEIHLLGKRNGFSPACAWRLRRVIARFRPDVLHSHNLGPLIYSTLATCGGSRVALLQGEHSRLTREELQPRRWRQRRWLYHACRAVHTVSATMRHELIAHGIPGAKIFAIANGVDTARFTPGDKQAARRALAVPADGLYLGIVGRFGPYKRHHQLLEAFEEIAPRFPQLHLLIAGNGGREEAAVTARAQSSPISSRIHLLGFRDDPHLCYQALDLLVVPSVNEGLSNALLESMACAVPALVRSHCGHEEVITTGVDGWIAPMESAAELSTLLAQLLAAPEQFVDFGRHARKKVTDRFTLESMILAYENLYRACAYR